MARRWVLSKGVVDDGSIECKLGPGLWKALNARLIMFGLYSVNTGEAGKGF